MKKVTIKMNEKKMSERKERGKIIYKDERENTVKMGRERKNNWEGRERK